MVDLVRQVEELNDSELMEAWLKAVLHGDEDSDFAQAARRELTGTRAYCDDDLETELDRALAERVVEDRIWAQVERGWNDRKAETEVA